MRFIKIIIILIVFVLACISLNAVDKISFDESILQAAGIKISIEKAELRTDGIIIHVQIKNMSKNKVVFDSGDLEFLDIDTGIGYYSLSKDKESVSLPSYLMNYNPIFKSTIESNRAIKGVLIFTAPNFQNRKEYKDFKNFQLSYKNVNIEMYIGKSRKK